MERWNVGTMEEWVLNPCTASSLQGLQAGVLILRHGEENGRIVYLQFSF